MNDTNRIEQLIATTETLMAEHEEEADSERGHEEAKRLAHVLIRLFWAAEETAKAISHHRAGQEDIRAEKAERVKGYFAKARFFAEGDP